MRRITILLVEDRSDERAIYSTVLTHHGHRVLETANAEQALDVARSDHPDLIIADLSLPSISGLALMQILRGSKLTSDIPIIAISAYPTLLEQAKEYDCAALLPKPLELENLIQEVDRHAQLPPESGDSRQV